MTQHCFRFLCLLQWGLLLFTLQLSVGQAQVVIQNSCDTDFSIPTQTFCEQDKLDQLDSAVKEQYQRLIELLQQSAEYYAQKYKDAYYDNFEMPYDVVKEELVKSQVLWQQYIDHECHVILKMSARGTAKNIRQLQCLQDYTQKRLKVLREYWEEVQLDATSLLGMPISPTTY